MGGVITTADSKSDGRMRIGSSERTKRRSVLKKMIRDGRGGPKLSDFKPVGYGKVSFSKASPISFSNFGKGKKLKLPSISSLIKSALKSSRKSGGVKFSKIRTAKIPKIKNVAKTKAIKSVLKRVR